jgi:hypothetical protein
MNDQTFDTFLNDATHKVCEIWEEVGGREISLEEKYQLNDLLTAFFADRK